MQLPESQGRAKAIFSENIFFTSRYCAALSVRNYPGLCRHDLSFFLSHSISTLPKQICTSHSFISPVLPRGQESFSPFQSPPRSLHLSLISLYCDPKKEIPNPNNRLVLLVVHDALSFLCLSRASRESCRCPRLNVKQKTPRSRSFSQGLY